MTSLGANICVINPTVPILLTIDSVKSRYYSDFLERIFALGYTDTINVLGPKITSELFEIPIMEGKKIPKRKIALAIGEKLPRVKKYNREIFITRAKLIHGNSINYSNIICINGSREKIPLSCNVCVYTWSAAVHTILSGKGCPSCGGNLPWTFEKLLDTVKFIYADKYDYKAVTRGHVQCNNSHIPITCNSCHLKWSPTIRQHIYDRTECPQCTGHLPITYDKFITVVNNLYGDDYDFSQIKESDIISTRSRVSVSCLICNVKWNPEVRSLIYHKTKCPGCNATTGERACMKALNSFNIKFEREIGINSLLNRLYDFRFVHDKIKWLLEYDGGQHFKYVPFFHDDNIETFYEHQNIDIIKTKSAIEEGYYVIRIDYTQINNIQSHIEQALRLKQSLYLSTPELYAHFN